MPNDQSVAIRLERSLINLKSRAIRRKALQRARHEGIGYSKALQRERRAAVLIAIQRDESGRTPATSWDDCEWFKDIYRKTGVSASFVRRVITAERLKSMMRGAPPDAIG